MRPGSPCQPEPRLVLEGAAVAERMVLRGFSAGTTNQISRGIRINNEQLAVVDKIVVYSRGEGWGDPSTSDWPA